MVEYITLAFAALAAFISLTVLINKGKSVSKQDLDAFAKQNEETMRQMRADLSTSLSQTISAVNEAQSNAQKQIAQMQDSRLAQMQSAQTDQLTLVEQRMKNTAAQTIQQLENIRTTVENKITQMQAENTKKLDEMRQTVDEKLQKTLEDKLNKSFTLVSERLEMVYKGLGEMQTLATNVGDLKKVLSNVKTRGIFGEIQLGAILEQILSQDQYETNVATVSGSSERVEYAIKLPGNGEKCVYLPIDAKFPYDVYSVLMAAYDKADAQEIETATKALEQRVKSFAKDIHDKYIRVPDTTDFGIMFLPIEGLYAEVVRGGLVEKLQNDYHVVIAGPTTMAALLNSLQMGFKTLAIQKRSGEVWEVLGSVKQEFDNFGKALAQTQQRLNQASNDLENLVGVRTRQIQRKLRSVSTANELVEEDALGVEGE